MISPDLVFLLLAGVAFLGFVLDALFDRLRITSVLPLMILGIALVQFRVLPPGTLGGLNALLPFVSSLTIAFILFHVGLGIRLENLSLVVGRTMAFTLSVQVGTGIALSLLAWTVFHWGVLLSFVFGFGLSGPSSISVPVLVRVARMPEKLRTSMLFESVVTDLLQLIVPLALLGLLITGNFSTLHVGILLLLTVIGSAATGLGAAIFWLWLLDRIEPIAKEFSWTLTITMVVATYGIADYLGTSAAITIFVFGLLIANHSHLRFDPFSRFGPTSTGWRRILAGLRRALHLRAEAVDVDHIQRVQKEVSFFTSAFFFVYIGLLFQTGQLSELVLLVPLFAAFVMLALRYAGTPLLSVYLSRDARARRSERSLVAFNIPRGLAAAIVATVPLSAHFAAPGFLNAMFLGILYSTVVSTVGIFLFYDPKGGSPAPTEATPPNGGEGPPLPTGPPAQPSEPAPEGF